MDSDASQLMSEALVGAGTSVLAWDMEADLLTGIQGPAQLIVSNPPYVPSGDINTLQPEVAQYEPASALYAGNDGLEVIRRLFAIAPPCLAEDGWMILEFGFGQEAGVRAAAVEAGWHVARVRNDLQGIPRVAVLRLRTRGSGLGD